MSCICLLQNHHTVQKQLSNNLNIYLIYQITRLFDFQIDSSYNTFDSHNSFYPFESFDKSYCFNLFNRKALRADSLEPVKMSIYNGRCYCRQISYSITLQTPDSARTSLCHCKNCKIFTGGPFGITTKISKSSFNITSDKKPKIHEADNGSGTLLHREFCGECGSGILEYGANAGDNVYIFYGTLGDEGRKELGPKG